MTKIAVIVIILMILSVSPLCLMLQIKNSMEKEPPFLMSNHTKSTLYVGQGQTYTKIQYAIDNASAGDTIRIYAGTYNESVVISKALTLIGNGSEVTIIDGNYYLSWNVITITSDWVNVIGFTVKHSSVVIYLDTVQHCSIEQNNIDSNNGEGISLSHSSNNSINNNMVHLNAVGINLFESNNNTVFNNNLTGNDFSIRLSSSNNNTLINNNISHNEFGIRLYNSNFNTITHNIANLNRDHGFCLELSSNNLLANNTANSNSEDGIHLEYANYNNIVNNYISNCISAIYLRLSSNNTIVFNNVESINNNLSTNYGLVLIVSNINTVAHNTISNTSIGMYFIQSINNIFSYNILTNDTEHGIFLEYATNTNIAYNHISNGEVGISFDLYSNDNTIYNNTIINNLKGINISRSSKNAFFNNNINNNMYGITFFYVSKNNVIFNNNFINNTTQVADQDYSNCWDDGSHGNYWSDWTSPDANNDGIVDIPYSIDGVAGAKDYFPLIKPFIDNGMLSFDNDFDTLPDSWEYEYFGNFNYGPNDDPDDDGLTNREEYDQGSNPTESDTPSTFFEKYRFFFLIIIVIITGLILISIIIARTQRAKNKEESIQKRPCTGARSVSEKNHGLKKNNSSKNSKIKSRNQ